MEIASLAGTLIQTVVQVGTAAAAIVTNASPDRAASLCADRVKTISQNVLAERHTIPRDIIDGFNMMLELYTDARVKNDNFKKWYSSKPWINGYVDKGMAVQRRGQTISVLASLTKAICARYHAGASKNENNQCCLCFPEHMEGRLTDVESWHRFLVDLFASHRAAEEALHRSDDGHLFTESTTSVIDSPSTKSETAADKIGVESMAAMLHTALLRFRSFPDQPNPWQSTQ